MPKGDADNLRADLDDGYAKLANLLLEALSCAPLTGTQYAVCMFIIRRTYGWAKGENRTSGKSDVIQAEEIARGTNTPRSSVHKAIRELVKAGIITSELVEAGNIFSYGMNPDIASWGDGGPDWKHAKVCLREAREAGTYSRKRTDLYPKSDTGIAENGQTSIRNRTHLQGTNACGTGDDGTPTDSITDSITDNNTNTPLAPTDSAIVSMAREEKKRRDAERQQQQLAKLDELMATLSPADRTLLDRMLAGQEQEKGKPLTSLQQLTQAEIFAKELAEHGAQCWHDCCEISCRRSIYTAEFARGCTKNWKPETPRLFQGKQERHLINPQGQKIWERDWEPLWLADINLLCKNDEWDYENGIMKCQYLDENGIPQMRTGKAS